MTLSFDSNEDYDTRYQTAFKNAFEKLSQQDKDSITSLPWFDPKIFLEYWGVDVSVDSD